MFVTTQPVKADPIAEAVELAVARAFAKSGRARAIRIRAELSLHDVAIGVGADPASIFRWETNQAIPRRAAAIRWARLMSELAEVIG